jgi:hypothetical protein
MAKYKITSSGVQNTETTCFIPNDDANYDWIAYKEWLSNGNVPDPEFTEQELKDKAYEKLRLERDVILNRTDFMVLPDVFSRYNEQEQLDITMYRKALRDLPKNTTDPEKPVWPTKPQVIIKAGI